MKWIGWPVAEIWPFEILQNARSVGRSLVLNIIHCSHTLLSATLGTYRARSKKHAHYPLHSKTVHSKVTDITRRAHYHCHEWQKLFHYPSSTTQVRKVLGTRKAPACLLTVVYAYGKPRLPLVHKYSSLCSNAHRAAACSRPLRLTLRYTHCVGSIVVKVQCQVLNR